MLLMMENWLFYLLYILIILSALLVIFSENAVYSVLFLILTFCNTIFLLLLMGAEFFAFLLLVVYVGAIAVLFLFVVMMLNLKKTSLINTEKHFFYFIPLVFLTFWFFFNLIFDLNTYFDKFNIIQHPKLIFVDWFVELNTLTNIESIGNVLYTDYCFLFIVSSFILLVSMIGVIVLTIHQKTNYVLKRQNINKQLIRNSKNIVKFVSLRN